MQKLSLGNPSTTGLQFGAQSAIAVAPDGSVWFGANSKLVHFDIGAGQPKSITIPSPMDNSTAEGVRPPSIRGYHAVESISINSAGVLAIAMSAASDVAEYNPATGSFTQLPLAGNAEPIAVAFNSVGDLAVATADWSDRGNTDSVQVFTGSASPVSVAVDSLGIWAIGSRFATTGDSARVGLVTVGADTSVVGSTLSVGLADQIQVGIAPQPLPSGSVILASRNGFDIVNLDGAAAASLRLPRFSCAGYSGTPDLSSSASSTSRSSGTCQEAPRAFASDALGNVWFTSNSDSHIAEIPAAAVATP